MATRIFNDQATDVQYTVGCRLRCDGMRTFEDCCREPNYRYKCYYQKTTLGSDGPPKGRNFLLQNREFILFHINTPAFGL